MTIGRLALVAAGLFCVAQLVPYGRAHTNPPKLSEPEWDSPNTRAMFFRVCRDCHSNETSWPWYSFVAPVSWLVEYDVNEGRSHLNVSEWGRGKQHGDEAAEKVREGEMPPWFYRPLHSSAQPSPTELKRFIAGLERTFGKTADSHDHGDHEH
jgi:mono/diheme cytochrome c family protein